MNRILRLLLVIATTTGYLGLAVLGVRRGRLFLRTTAYRLGDRPVCVRYRGTRLDAEEQLLTEQFGDEYLAYRARTSRLIPGFY